MCQLNRVLAHELTDLGSRGMEVHGCGKTGARIWGGQTRVGRRLQDGICAPAEADDGESGYALGFQKVAKDGKVWAFGRLSKVRIKLSDFTFRAVESNEVLSIHRDYFLLRRPLERRVYEIVKKHIGDKKEFKIGIAKLHAKVGTCAPLKRFRFNVKEMIDDGNIPEFGFMLDGDVLIAQRLVPVEAIEAPKSMIRLRGDTLDKAQKIAAMLGVSLFDLEREWNEWAADKVDEIQSPDAAFIGFCNKKLPSGGASRVIEARDAAHDAGQLALVMPDLKMDRK